MEGDFLLSPGVSSFKKKDGERRRREGRNGPEEGGWRKKRK